MDIIWCNSCSGKRQSRAETSAPPKVHPLNEKRCINNVDTPLSCSVGGDGFEPPKASPADLQSVPFGHSGNPPYTYEFGAGGRIRTPDLLITNQLLYQLSYTSTTTSENYATIKTGLCQQKVL